MVASTHLVACHCCGLVQELPAPPHSRYACGRCSSLVWDPARARRHTRWTAALALSALILFPVAVSLPIMRIERFGHLKQASIWEGSVGLLSHGEFFVGTVVLVCSMVLPLFKLLGLLTLSSGASWLGSRQRSWTYRLIEWTGRWGMLDVLLIAVVVAWVKVGDLVEVRPGPAALAFTVCVLLSLLASASFDPHALWDEELSRV